MKKSLGLVAHDEKKQLLADWCKKHLEHLSKLELFSTGTTGKKIIEHTGLDLTRLKSGPFGGDAQLGAMIAEERLDGLAAMPHDVDVKALIRLATIYDVPFACNRSTANAVLELF